MKHRGILLLAVLVLLAATVASAADVPLRGWNAPKTYGGAVPLADISNMVPFTAVTPCRIVDTRGATGAFGGPILAGGSSRTFTIPSGPCTGIPATAEAYSLNFTVTNTAGAGFILAYPAGGSSPTVSTLNYVANDTVANAAIVPAGTSGGITVVAGVSATHLIIDINGYYASAPSGTGFLNINTSGSYAASLYTTGSNDALHVQCSVSNSCWAIHSVADAAGTGYSGYFTGAHGIYSSVSATGSVAVTGVSTADNGGEFTTNAASGQFGGVVGHATTAVVDNFFVPSGIRGIGGNIGALGISTNFGAVGARVDGTGAIVTASYSGRDATNGTYTIGNTAATGTKNFIEPHPTDPTKVIRYTSLEGAEAGTYFRGRARFDGKQAVIDVPEDFRLVTDAEGLSIQVTPIGDFAQVAVVALDTRQIVLKATRDVEFFYTVNGVRKTFRNLSPIIDNDYYMPSSAQERMPLGFSEAQKRLLIENGTYNADGTVNMSTADRLGWTRAWQQRDDLLRVQMEQIRAKRVEPQHD